MRPRTNCDLSRVPDQRPGPLAALLDGVPLVVLLGAGPLDPRPQKKATCRVCGAVVRRHTYCAQCDRTHEDIEQSLLWDRLTDLGRPADAAAQSVVWAEERAVTSRLDGLLRRFGGRLPERVRRRIAVGCRRVLDDRAFDWGSVACPAAVGASWLAARGQLPGATLLDEAG